MIPPNFESPLHEMATTTPTQFWNDSCSVNELRHAIAHGAVGATANPVICGEVLKKELTEWTEPIKRIVSEMPVATEDEITWKVVEELSVKAARLLAPIHFFLFRLHAAQACSMHRMTDLIHRLKPGF